MHKNRILFFIVTSLVVFSCGQTENKPVELVSDIDKYSYAVGYQVGSQLKELGLEYNTDVLARAISDVLNGNEIIMTSAEMSEIRTKMMAQLQEGRDAQAEENLASALEWLEENSKKEGVVTLPSGLQYKVISDGTGPKPGPIGNVKTHYRGTFINGDEFDSSYSRNEPAVFGISGVIKGWTEALQLMNEGAKWQLFIPPDLGYGASGNSSIPPNSVLIFDLELLQVIK